MEGDKYSHGFIREKTRTEKARNGKAKKVHVCWRGFLKYQEPNPGYVEPPKKGTDTRTAPQKRRTIWRQVSTTFDPETVRTKSEALDALSDWKKRMNAAARIADLPSAQTSVGAYVDAFIDDLEASRSIERRTVRDYRGIARHISSGFEGVALCDLTPTMIQKWVNGLTKAGRAPATVIKYYRLLSEACKDAVDKDHLVKNPCQAVKTPKRDAPSPNSLTAEGYARLAATLDVMEPTPLATAATIALHTGMRQGEVCGLRWRCYDPERRTIEVKESIGVAHGGTYSKTPKTKSSQRVVPVSPQLADAMERRRAAMVREMQGFGVTMNEREFGALYVVGFIDGRFYDPLRISKEWGALSATLGLEGTQGRKITFHDLRHSFATRAIAMGAPAKSVAAVLGHANAAITLNVYADADAESKQRVIELTTHAIAAQGEVEPYAIGVAADGTPEAEV